MSRTYRDPLDHIRWDPPEFRNRVRWGLVEFELQGPDGFYDWPYTMKAKRFTKRRWAHIRRSRDKGEIKRELEMMAN